MMGVPLSEVEVHPGGFGLAVEGGSRELWSRTYGFAYSQARDGWYLERVDMKVLYRIAGRGADKSATGEQIGVVSIADLDAVSMARDAVISARHPGLSADSMEHVMLPRNELVILIAARASAITSRDDMVNQHGR